MSTRTSIKVLFFVCFVMVWSGIVQPSALAQSMTAPNLIPGKIEDLSSTRTPYEEILQTFEREARAAYAEAKRSCQALVEIGEQERCLAKARLQFDADMRYAQQRAAAGS